MPGGAPLGNQNGAKGRRWRDAIERAVAAWPKPVQDDDWAPMVRGLNKAAHAFVGTMLASNDIAFFKEFGDRLDGKSVQQVDLDARVDAQVTVNVLRFADMPSEK